MQEEVTQKTIALSMKTGKLTAQALQAALKKYLQHRAKGPKLHHGKQSLKQLKAHGASLTNIEVTEANNGASRTRRYTWRSTPGSMDCGISDTFGTMATPAPTSTAPASTLF